MALDVWQADVVEDRLGGRTGPFVLGCERKGAEGRSSFVVKGLGLPEITERSLFCELFGNLLARELGVPTPRPALVKIAADLSAAMRSIGGVALSPGLAVGAAFLKGTAQAAYHPIPPHTIPDAALLYAFDLVVQNPDRREMNPNCFLHGGRVVAFDFEACFSFLLAIGGDPEPWALSLVPLGGPHLFRGGLREAARGRDGLDWAPFLAAIRGLDDTRIRRMIRRCRPLGGELGQIESASTSTR